MIKGYLNAFAGRMPHMAWWKVAWAGGAVLVVFLGLLNYTGRFESIIAHFSIPSEYRTGIVLFYGEGCNYCDNVEKFIAANKVEETIVFKRLEVIKSQGNRNILYDRAQVCGIPESQIGVPFLWDGGNKACVLGYLDIIAFFKQKMQETAKSP